MVKSKIPKLKSFIAKAIKKRKIYIIVEGENDIYFYEKLCKDVKIESEIIPIEFLTDYSNMGNCDKVINYMKDIRESEIGKIEDKRRYFLGIIDGDARKYKNRLPESNELLYILKYYSWESYYVNREVVSKSIKNYLRTIKISDILIDYIYINYIQKHLLEELWLFALKSLKEDENIKNINRLHEDNKFVEELLTLKDELSLFAKEKNLILSEDTLLEITRGKDALAFFVKKYLKVLKELPKLCRDSHIEEVKSCIYCEHKGDSNNCLYKLRVKKREDDIKGDITTLTDLNSLIPIKNRIRELRYF